MEKRPLTASNASLKHPSGRFFANVFRKRFNLKSTVPHLLQRDLVQCSLHTFPTELLELIFKFCLLDYEEWSPQDRRHLITFSLSFVCRRWREVALNVPYLWSYLPRIKFPTRRTKSTDLDILAVVLQRSKDQDLWLRIELAIDYKLDGCELAWINKLAAHAHRLRGLVIQASCTVLDEFCSAQKCSDPAFPRLQKLGLHLYKDSTNELTTPWFSEFNAPNLQEVSISGNINPHNFGVTHTGLKVFRASTDTETRQRQIINSVLKGSNGTLEQLEISFTPLTSQPTVFEAPISMRTLRHLSIRYNPYDSNVPDEIRSNTILEELRLPVLESLNLENYFPGYLASDIISLEGAFLRRLRLRGKTRMSPGRLIRVLQSVPNLEEIDVPLPQYFDLRTLSSDSQLVPHLKKISFQLDFAGPGMNQKVILALLDIGKLRFKRQVSVANRGTPHQAYQKLERLTILIDGDRSIHSTMAALNQWRSDSQPGNNSKSELVRLGEDLFSREKQIQDLEWETGRHESVAEARIWTELKDIFLSIMKYSPSTEDDVKDIDLRDIYLSRLPIILEGAVRMTKYSIGGTKRYKVYNWAQSILRNWESIFLHDISRPDTTFLWTREVGRGVMYVPADHPIRTSPNALRLIYGLEAEQASSVGFTRWH